MLAIYSICISGTKTRENNKGANINVGNIPRKVFYHEAVFSQWKSNIECWIFLPPPIDFYFSIEYRDILNN